MKKIFTLSLTAILTVSFCFGQNVAVNTDASLPNSSAMLDVKSASKGILIPRVALTGTDDISTIAAPAISLMVYNTAVAGYESTSVVPGYYYWDRSWIKLVGQKGGAVSFADFYALMPNDNPGAIPSFGEIPFPQTAVANSSITRFGATQFILPDIATYEVTFLVSVNEPTQLGISLNGNLVPSSVAGRNTGTTQIVGTSLITTTDPYSFLSVVNTGYSAITLTSYAGGMYPVSAHLVIKKLN